jgi:colanic acid/amylovoran biosynthesis glycosyltransferase
VGEPVLGVLVPQAGHLSETFVRRHVEKLVPDARLYCFGIAAEPAWTFSRTSLIPEARRRGSVARAAIRLAGGEPALGQLTRPDTASFVAQLRADGITDVLLEYLDSWVPYLDAFASAGVRVHAHAHGYDVSARLRQPWCARAYRRYADRAHSVICVSDFLVQRLASIGIPRERLHVVPCGVDVPTAAPRRTGHGQYWLAVGRLVAKKGHEQAIRAMALLPESVRETTRLRIVGDGPLRDRLQALVEEKGLQSAVEFAGALPNPEVKQLFDGATGFIHHALTDPVTGDEEGMPVALLEAMAAGLPIVTTRHAGIPEAVAHGVTGYVVEERDVEATAMAMAELTVNAQLNVSMGLAGWERAGEAFSWDRERRELRALLGVT